MGVKTLIRQIGHSEFKLIVILLVQTNGLLHGIQVDQIEFHFPPLFCLDNVILSIVPEQQSIFIFGFQEAQ